MAEFKLVMSDSKSGMSYQRAVAEPDSKRFVGLKIGDTVKGELINLTGYEFLLTGGSDYCGFPMRRDVSGSGRKRILAVSGVGFHQLAKGIKQRKTVCGNTVGLQTVQVNLKITKQGKEPLAAEGAEPAQKEAKPEQPAQAANEPEQEKPAKKEKPAKEEKAAKEKK